MITEEDINSIFERITETYETPISIGGRCESKVFYRVEDLREKDLNMCAEYVAWRLKKTIAPSTPQVFLKLPGGYTFFSERLFAFYQELVKNPDDIVLKQYVESKISNGYGEPFKGKTAVLITDVITTARSSLEAHSRATLRGINVICWATLVDRTFGPGPVPVVSALTGAPVRLLTGYV